MSPFEPGKLYRRVQDIHQRFGGQRQGGISTPSAHPYVFLFTGESGSSYGYKDDFRPDGTFWYTGEGQVGDMKMDRGNAAIKDHGVDGKSLVLFEYVSNGRVRCVGDATYLGHHIEQRPDRNGNIRNAFVFELDVNSNKTVKDAPPPKQITQTSEPFDFGLGLFLRCEVLRRATRRLQ